MLLTTTQTKPNPNAKRMLEESLTLTQSVGGDS